MHLDDLFCVVLTFITAVLVCTVVSTESVSREKRELPLSYKCTPGVNCHKGDLISQSIADCKKSSILYTCNPINDYSLSSVVDLPDVSRHDVDCGAKTGLSIHCGAAGTDTRCVCDKAVDYKRPLETLFNQCRCQYWPATDDRMNQPSYCTQYDHGGTSNIHFYTCCNNCDDSDTSCRGNTYQGGGSTGAYCGDCGLNSPLGGGRITYRFNCVSCAQQRACETRCDKEFLGLTSSIPGLCPRWSGCFRGCCQEAERQAKRRKRQSQDNSILVEDFCGDFTCQSGEDHTNCPIDCCPVVNPSECSPNDCNPDCCLEPRCCIIGNNINVLHASCYLIYMLVLCSIVLLSL